MNRIVIPLYYIPCFPVRIVSVKIGPPPVSNPPPVKVTRPSRRLTIVNPKMRVVVTPPGFPPPKLTIDMAIDAPLAPIRVGNPTVAVVAPLWDFYMSAEEFQTMSTAMSVAEAVLN
jgi:hypothetical protein